MYAIFIAARKSLRYRANLNVHSEPGNPPFRHRRYGEFGIHKIYSWPMRFHQYETHRDDTGYVGPIVGKGRRRGRQAVPGVLEKGGVARPPAHQVTQGQMIRSAIAINAREKGSLQRVSQEKSRLYSRVANRRFFARRRNRRDPTRVAYLRQAAREIKAGYKVKPRPFMVPARDKVAPRMSEYYRRALQQESRRGGSRMRMAVEMELRKPPRPRRNRWNRVNSARMRRSAWL